MLPTAFQIPMCYTLSLFSRTHVIVCITVKQLYLLVQYILSDNPPFCGSTNAIPTFNYN